MILTEDDNIVIPISIKDRCPQLVKFDNDGNIIDSIDVECNGQNGFETRVTYLKKIDNSVFIAIGSYKKDDLYYLWLNKFDNELHLLQNSLFPVKGELNLFMGALVKPDGNIVVASSSGDRIIDSCYFYLCEYTTNLEIVKSKVHSYYGWYFRLVFNLSMKNNIYYRINTPIAMGKPPGYEMITKFDTDFNILSYKFLPRIGVVNDTKWINDTVMLVTGRDRVATGDSYMGMVKIDTAINLLKYNTFNNSGDTTDDTPGMLTSLDYINTDIIFYGGFLNRQPFENTIINLFKTDTTLEIKWKKYYGGDASYGLNSILATNDGGCVLAGSYCKPLANERDIFIMKVNNDGNFSWVYNLPVTFLELKVYPNPGNDFMIVNNPPSNTKLILYNINGQKLKELELDVSNSVNTEDLESGMYFYQLIDKKDNVVAKGKWVKK
jgi:hypothetical protein